MQRLPVRQSFSSISGYHGERKLRNQPESSPQPMYLQPPRSLKPSIKLIFFVTNSSTDLTAASRLSFPKSRLRHRYSVPNALLWAEHFGWGRRMPAILWRPMRAWHFPRTSMGIEHHADDAFETLATILARPVDDSDDFESRSRSRCGQLYQPARCFSRIFTSRRKHLFRSKSMVSPGPAVPCKLAGFNYLAQSSTKIPQTEAGMDGLKGAYRAVCQQAVANQNPAPCCVEFNHFR